MIYMLIALGGALGSLARFGLAGLLGTRLGEGFPWGTLIVNVSGCIVIGFFAGLGSVGPRWFATPEARSLLLVGLCGGYTTFSAFSLQTLELLRSGDWPRALGYTLASVVVCLAGVWLGQLLASAFSSAP